MGASGSLGCGTVGMFLALSEPPEVHVDCHWPEFLPHTRHFWLCDPGQRPTFSDPRFLIYTMRGVNPRHREHYAGKVLAPGAQSTWVKLISFLHLSGECDPALPLRAFCLHLSLSLRPSLSETQTLCLRNTVTCPVPPFPHKVSFSWSPGGSSPIRLCVCVKWRGAAGEI